MIASMHEDQPRVRAFGLPSTLHMQSAGRHTPMTKRRTDLATRAGMVCGVSSSSSRSRYPTGESRYACCAARRRARSTGSRLNTAAAPSITGSGAPSGYNAGGTTIEVPMTASTVSTPWPRNARFSSVSSGRISCS